MQKQRGSAGKENIMRKLTKEMKVVWFKSEFDPVYRYRIQLKWFGEVVYTIYMYAENPDRALVKMKVPWGVWWDDATVEEF